MKQIDESGVKEISIGILDDVNYFCKQNDIKYSLAYGTLLGAVRHKGFIPWDDDIDIMMFRSDYNKFVATYNAQSDSHYKVWSFETDKEFPYPFAKIEDSRTIVNELGYTKLGVTIDLFPIDIVSINENEAKRKLQLSKLFWMLFMAKAMRWSCARALYKNIIMVIIKTFLQLLPYRTIHNLMNKMLIERNDKERQYNMGCLFGPYGIKEIMPSGVFRNTPPGQSHLRKMSIAA